MASECRSTTFPPLSLPTLHYPLQLPQVLVLIIGDDHTIVAWYVLRSESWVEMRVGLKFLRDRLEQMPPRARADAECALDELEEWWSDRCCDGAADVKKHPIVAIFHGSRIWRAPRKDTFHAINGVNKTGYEGVPEQKSQLGSGLFRALREIPDSELQPVVDYLQQKSRVDDLSARTKALSDYRHAGIIRNRTFSSERQLKRWRYVRQRWAERYEESRRTGDRCVIRPQRGQLQGKLEAMEAMEPCIAKGCLCDPWRMEDMYINTKKQPVTGLQERLHVGDSGKNEARHRVLNELVEHVSRVGEDLMEADLDFLIYFSNRKYDVLFGRIDAHSLGCFPWADADFNGEAAHLDGPPPFPLAAAPRNALAPIEPIEEGHPRWEPLGFAYLHYLRRNHEDRAVAVALAASEAVADEAELKEDEIEELQLDVQCAAAVVGDADGDAPTMASSAAGLVASPMRAPVVARAVPPLQSAAATGKAARALQQTPLTSVNGGGGKHGSRWSGARKARLSTVENSKPIEPTSLEERQVMAAAVTEAMRAHGSASDAMYASAAEIYREKATLILTDPLKAPPSPHLLRPRTSASQLKQVSVRCMQRQQRVGQELEFSGRAGAAVGQADEMLMADEIAAAHAPPPAAHDLEPLTPSRSTVGEGGAAIEALNSTAGVVHSPGSVAETQRMAALLDAVGGVPLAASLLEGVPVGEMLEGVELPSYVQSIRFRLAGESPQLMQRKPKRDLSAHKEAVRSLNKREVRRRAVRDIHHNEVMSLPGYVLHELIVSGSLVGKVSEKVSLAGLGKHVPRPRRPLDDIRRDVLAAWPPGQDVVTIGVHLA